MVKKAVFMAGVTAIFIMFASLMVFSGCKDQESAAASERQITVIDGEGTEIDLEKPAERVVVMAPSVLELADGLGALDKVVEIDSFTVMMQEPVCGAWQN